MDKLRDKSGSVAGYGGKEHRRAPRMKVRLRPQKILNSRGGLIADCAMIDRSATGARLRLYEAKELPKIFLLFDEAEKTTLLVELMWRGKFEAGVRFSKPVPL